MNQTVVPFDRKPAHPSQDRSVGSGPFRHCIRTSWGYAICAKRQGRFVQYYFEDGERRRIATAYEHLLEPADLPVEEAEALVKKLRTASGLDEVTPSVDPSEVPTLEQQDMVFRHRFPKGFAGQRWRAERRGEDAPRRLKRHRNAAVDMALELLSEPRLRMLIHMDDHEEVVRSMVEVLRWTTLVSKRRLAPLKKLPPHCHAEVSEALMQLLYGGPFDGDDYPERFGNFVSALRGPRRKIHWSLATALPALVYPQHHVCVRPKRIRKQAVALGAELMLPKTADMYAYPHVQAMVQGLLGHLQEQGFEPRDMLDVHDFMAVTLKPSAMVLLRELDPDAFPEPEVEEEVSAVADDDDERDAA